MMGWAMFWLCCTSFIIYCSVREYLYHKRIMWAAKNGYSYNSETGLWTKTVKDEEGKNE